MRVPVFASSSFVLRPAGWFAGVDKSTRETCLCSSSQAAAVDEGEGPSFHRQFPPSGRDPENGPEGIRSAHGRSEKTEKTEGGGRIGEGEKTLFGSASGSMKPSHREPKSSSCGGRGIGTPPINRRSVADREGRRFGKSPRYELSPPVRSPAHRLSPGRETVDEATFYLRVANSICATRPLGRHRVPGILSRCAHAPWTYISIPPTPPYVIIEGVYACPEGRPSLNSPLRPNGSTRRPGNCRIAVNVQFGHDPLSSPTPPRASAEHADRLKCAAKIARRYFPSKKRANRRRRADVKPGAAAVSHREKISRLR